VLNKRPVLLVLLALAAVVTAACGGGGKAETEDTTDATDADKFLLTEDVPFVYTATVDGDIRGTVAGEVITRFARNAPIEVDNPKNPRFISLEQFAGITGGGYGARVALTVVGFEGNGHVEIPPGSRSDPNPPNADGAVRIRPQVQVFWGSATDASAPQQIFDRRTKPCVVDATDDGRKGTLRCPEMTNDLGKKASLVLDWQKK
jgi:hypothetical protein